MPLLVTCLLGKAAEMFKRVLLILILSFNVVMCGDEAKDADILDYRVSLPEADPAYLDLIPPEMIIPAYTERMYCYYITHQGEDLAVSTLEAKQGPFGHHLALLKATQVQEDRLLQDCTDESAMGDLRTFVLPGIKLPESNAIKITEGEQFVLQFHYVNAGRQDIRVRDLARLKLVEASSVETWVNTFTTNSALVSVPAQSSGMVEFDCVLSEGLSLLVVGGHMHELGTRFDLAYGQSAETLTSIYNVDPWISQFRDSPPVTAMLSEPIFLEVGSLVRTSCAWTNATDSDVAFPAEMCSAFGYLSGSSNPFHCEETT
jgi:hypothetical protein